MKKHVLAHLKHSSNVVAINNGGSSGRCLGNKKFYNQRQFHIKKQIEQPKRVVVTGLGVVSPLGCEVNTFWNDLTKAKSGIKIAPQNFEQLSDKEKNIWSKLQSRVGGYIDQIGLDKALDKCLACTEQTNRSKSIQKSRLSKFIQFGMIAATEALNDSKLQIDEALKPYVGVSMGSSLGAAAEIGEAYSLVDNEQQKKVSPVFYPRVLNNMASGYIAMQHDLQGPLLSMSTACATGAHSIGEAYQMIKYNQAKVMLCGGCENSIYPVFYVGFARARALTTNLDPEKASRPFDKDRDGFIMSEGAGCLVLEELEHALNRGARIYAEIGGYGASGDAYHPTAPSPDGKAAISAMRNALNESILDISIEDINHVNCHATSTPTGDKVELSAVQTLFKDASQKVYINSLKGALGHMLGAAGASESVGTVLSIYHNIIPPTLNFENLDEDITLSDNIEIVSNQSKQTQLTAALCNSFGFGGTNSSILFCRYK
ncbi:hypothetical protein ABK040_004481 [Willaertia magna]